MNTLPRIPYALICITLTVSCLTAAQIESPAVVRLEKKNDSGLALRGSLGVVDGQADELVYYEGTKVSELNWDLKDILMGGLALTWDRGPVQLNIGLWSAMTEGNGKMYDYDWLKEDTSEWSDRSVSDNIVDSGILFDINGSLLAQTFPLCDLRLMCGIKYQYWEMRDLGGQYVYSSLHGFRDEAGTFGDGTAIYYEQEFLIPYLGVILEGMTGPIDWGTYLTWSPLVTAKDKDHHALRTEVSEGGIHFSEEFSGGTCIGLGGSAAVNLSESVKLGVCLDYQLISEISGDTTIEETGEFSEDSAGIENGWVSVSLTVSARL